MICLCYNQCLKWGKKCTSVFILIFINPRYTVLHILSHCTSYSLFYFIICSYFHSHLYLYTYILLCYVSLLFNFFVFYLFFYFFALSIERTCPDLHFTIPCMIVYVTNNKEPWTLKGGGTHWQIITFLQWKTKLGDIAGTTIYCYLFINNINLFKHVCVCVAVCVRVFHKN